MMLARRVESVRGRAELIQLMPHDHEALNGVVVDLARDSGTLFLVRFEQPARVGPVHGDEPALRDHHCDA